MPDLNAIKSAFNYDCNCVNAFGKFTLNNTNSSSRAGNRSATEKDSSSYIQADFKFDLLSVPFRGNLGVRQVKTDEDVTGYIGKGSTAVPTEVTRTYSNTLPALNVTAEPLDNFFVRFAMAKTMSRPTLISMTPGGSITTSSQTIGSASTPVGNPYLNPILANNTDLSIEWYPDKEGLISLGLFKKDIKSYIQTVATVEPFSATGYDPSILAGATGQDGTTPYIVYSSVNTPGGPLQGYELNIQHPFTFLPGVLKHFGGIVNYTHITSKINYALSTSATLGGGATTNYGLYNLLGLSPISWNATLYYSDDRLDARVALASRSDYLSLIQPGSSAFAQGKHATTNIDSQITYKLNKHFTLVFEGINLTDQYDERFDIYNIKYTNTANTAGVPAAVTINNPDAQLDYSHPGRTYYVGVRYKY